LGATLKAKEKAMKYEFYKQIRCPKQEFNALKEAQQLDTLYDVLDDMCLAGDKWEELTAIFEEYDPDQHPLTISIGMMTMGKAPFELGHIPKATWRAFYHRVKCRAIQLGRDEPLLLKGFPTAYLYDDLDMFVLQLEELQKEIGDCDCRINDDLQADDAVARPLARAIGSLDSLLVTLRKAAEYAKKRENHER
jgi:hypothetical protein